MVWSLLVARPFFVVEQYFAENGNVRGTPLAIPSNTSSFTSDISLTPVSLIVVLPPENIG